MPELFTITFELGSGASLGSVREAVHDLEVVGLTAQAAAEVHIEHASQQRLVDTYLGSPEGLQALVDLAKQQQILTGDEIDSFSADARGLDQELDDLVHFLPFRRSRKMLASTLFGSIPVPEAFPLAHWPWRRLFDRLVAVDTSEQLAEIDLRVRALQYANPVTVDIVVTAPAAILALVPLLAVIRDWKPRQREANARARLAEATAREPEDTVRARSQLRRNHLERISRSDLNLTGQEAAALLTDPLLIASERLADRELDFHHERLPDDTGPNPPRQLRSPLAGS